MKEQTINEVISSYEKIVKLEIGEMTSLLKKSIEYLGHEDSNLREKNAELLSGFLRDESCPKEVRPELLKILTSPNQLFYKIESSGDTYALKRSFSSLALAALLYGDIKHETFISSDLLLTLADDLGHYLETEKNTSGFLENFGWVHCYAHFADAATMLFYHPNLKQFSIQKLLGNILLFCMNVKPTFSYGEEFRLARAISSAIKVIEKEETLKIFMQYNIEKLLIPFPQNMRIVFTSLFLLIDRDKNKELSQYLFNFVTYF